MATVRAVWTAVEEAGAADQAKLKKDITRTVNRLKNRVEGHLIKTNAATQQSLLFDDPQERAPEAEAAAPPAPPRFPEPALRVYGKDLAEHALQHIPRLAGCQCLDDVRKYLTDHLRFNSQATRRRNASYLISRYFPGDVLHADLIPFAAAVEGKSALGDALFYLTARTEKIIALVAEEVVFPSLALGGVSRAKIRDFVQAQPYFADYAKGFTWPAAIGSEKFNRFFPFYPPAIDVLKAVSYNLTTLRSSVHFMHQTLKTQRKARSNELITLWQMFDDVVSYEEDPSGTTAGIAAISSKFHDEYKAYQAGRRNIGQATKGRFKVYASRCEKILKTLFLYHIARMQPGGLSVEEIMNSVMEWVDHDKGQQADVKDNLDHDEILLDELDRELPQVKKVGKNFVFSPEGGGVDVKELFQKARSQAEHNEVQRREAWHQLLGLDGWEIKTSLLTMDLARNTRSIFRGIAPAEQKDVEVEWHGRTIKGRVYMRDLLEIASKGQALPPLNTADTDHDFAVFISNRPCGDKVTELAKKVGDARTLFWTPAQLSSQEKDRLLDFAAYRELVKDHQHKDTDNAYRICVRRGSEEEAKPKRKNRKKQNDDE